MHRQLRISFSKRQELLAENIAICSATLDHMTNCTVCTDEAYCTEGAVLYEKFREVKARARLVVDPDPSL